MKKSFFQVLTDAVNFFAENGYKSEKVLDIWVKRLRQAAYDSLIPEKTLIKTLEKSLGQVYRRMVTQGGLVKSNPEVTKFTIEKLKPKMKAELDRRILASANLIKLNREEAISNTLRRFQGWATSIPIGGSDAVDRREEKSYIKKSMSKLDFEERRVFIDQSHKLSASINSIVATNSGAIAAKWHSHWRQANYDYREDHKERDSVFYVIKDSWADKKGYLKAINGYTDDITQPGEEVFCRCNYEYIYSLRDLPENMLTAKGKDALKSSKIQAR